MSFDQLRANQFLGRLTRVKATSFHPERQANQYVSNRPIKVDPEANLHRRVAYDAVQEGNQQPYKPRVALDHPNVTERLRQRKQEQRTGSRRPTWMVPTEEGTRLAHAAGVSYVSDVVPSNAERDRYLRRDPKPIGDIREDVAYNDSIHWHRSRGRPHRYYDGREMGYRVDREDIVQPPNQRPGWRTYGSRPYYDE